MRKLGHLSRANSVLTVCLVIALLGALT